MSDNWYPLSSNPDALNEYLNDMGVDISKYSISPIYSLEDWAFEMVPIPVKAIILLFPITEKI